MPYLRWLLIGLLMGGVSLGAAKFSGWIGQYLGEPARKSAPRTVQPIAEKRASPEPKRIAQPPHDLRLIAREQNELRLAQLPVGVFGYSYAFQILEGDPNVYRDIGTFGFQVRKRELGRFAILVYVNKETIDSIRSRVSGHQEFVGYSAPLGEAALEFEIERSQLASGTASQSRDVGEDAGDLLQAWDLVVAPGKDRTTSVRIERIENHETGRGKRIGVLVAWTEGESLYVSGPRWLPSGASGARGSRELQSVASFELLKIQSGCAAQGSPTQAELWLVEANGVELTPRFWSTVGQQPIDVKSSLGHSWHRLAMPADGLDAVDSAVRDLKQFEDSARFELPLGCNKSSLLGEFKMEAFGMDESPVRVYVTLELR
jgi:hypothetical protein